MNIISQYEQGYLSLSEFIIEFPDSISESQEALYGARCIEFYVAVALGKIDCCYYVQRYGGDCYEMDEGLCIEEDYYDETLNPFHEINIHS